MIENKLSLSEREEITESVAAFATASGGIVRIGLGNDGRRGGIQIGCLMHVGACEECH